MTTKSCMQILVTSIKHDYQSLVTPVPEDRTLNSRALMVIFMQSMVLAASMALSVIMWLGLVAVRPSIEHQIQALNSNEIPSYVLYAMAIISLTFTGLTIYAVWTYPRFKSRNCKGATMILLLTVVFYMALLIQGDLTFRSCEYMMAISIFPILAYKNALAQQLVFGVIACFMPAQALMRDENILKPLFFAAYVLLVCIAGMERKDRKKKENAEPNDPESTLSADKEAVITSEDITEPEVEPYFKLGHFDVISPFGGFGLDWHRVNCCNAFAIVISNNYGFIAAAICSMLIILTIAYLLAASLVYKKVRVGWIVPLLLFSFAIAMYIIGPDPPATKDVLYLHA